MVGTRNVYSLMTLLNVYTRLLKDAGVNVARVDLLTEAKQLRYIVSMSEIELAREAAEEILKEIDANRELYFPNTKDSENNNAHSDNERT